MRHDQSGVAAFFVLLGPLLPLPRRSRGRPRGHVRRPASGAGDQRRNPPLVTLSVGQTDRNYFQVAIPGTEMRLQGENGPFQGPLQCLARGGPTES